MFLNQNFSDMKIKAIIKKTAKRSDKESEATVYLRLIDGRNLDLSAPTKEKINPNLWDEKAQEIKSKCIYNEESRNRFNKTIGAIKTFVGDEYSLIQKETIGSNWLKEAVDKFYHPEKYLPEDIIIVKPSFHELFNEFLDKHKLSEVRKKNFRVIGRALRRYELYIQQIFEKDYKIDIDTFSADDIRDLENFLKAEHTLAGEAEYKKIYEIIPEKRAPLPRGQNTLNDILVKLRTFFIWACKVKKTCNNPFTDFKIEECVYGTPYYITIDERNQLYKTDLSDTPELAIQRDIFVFQCLIGCRVGDFYRMTKNNVINGAIEYIARKTKDGRPVTVRVPLNEIAREILTKYKDEPGEKLFPFIIEQYYNEAIKAAFLKAGLTRMVTVINQTSREEEKRPLNELASSHLARRCFVGNLYKKVKDPNLVGALSGHKEGSKAFARYREIDEDIKNQLVKMLE